jgi:formylglycine-generating enzyme required for sulfatase activity
MANRRWKLVALVGLGVSACQLVAGIHDLPTAPAADGGAGASDLDAANVGDAGGGGPAGGDGGANDGASPDGGPDGGPTPDGGSFTRGASCVGLPSTCGGTASSDCCASPLVPGGTFKRGYDGVGNTDGTKVATVSDFRLDAFEVTVGRYRKFVEAYPGSKPAVGAGKHPKNPFDTGWDASWTNFLPSDQSTLRMEMLNSCDGPINWRDAAGNNPGTETTPITCVTWYEAYAFCAWDGGRLPTEAEWNYAAAGGSDQRVYPWSVPAATTTIDPTYAIYSGVPFRTVGVDSPKGDGKWGHSDLAGNVREWVLDLFDGYPIPCSDCAILSSGTSTSRSIRGGWAGDAPSNVTASARYYQNPTGISYAAGIRCVRDP